MAQIKDDKTGKFVAIADHFPKDKTVLCNIRTARRRIKKQAGMPAEEVKKSETC